MVRKRILVVDDDPELTEVVEACLSGDFELIVKNSSGEALLAAKKNEIHLLITDFSMPEMNGVELTSKIVQMPQYQFLPVFLLTGVEDDLARSVIQSIPRIQFFEKPVQMQELLEKVKATLNI